MLNKTANHGKDFAVAKTMNFRTLNGGGRGWEREREISVKQ
jgi:hypothetical protein